MPVPKRYLDRAELIRDLKKYQWREWFQKHRYQDSDLHRIIADSVGANIFRAFRHLPEKPSVVFRNWAYDSFNEQFLEEFCAVGSRSQYRDWAYRVSRSLRRCWKGRMDRDMPYGPSLKLTNLIAKRLCLSKQTPFPKMAKFLDVPLDAYTIRGVANFVFTFPDSSAIGRVPFAATMSFIQNQGMYEAFQEGIYQITHEANVPSIALDCLLWDAAH
jgi:hypothetical protein